MASNENAENELIRQRRDNLEELKQKDRDPFRQVKFEKTHGAGDVVESFDALEGENVKIRGRLMAKRQHGRACFVDLRDMSGTVQLFFSQGRVGEEEYEKLTDRVDIGDFLGVNGEVFRTRRGEISVNVDCFQLLSKALRPLPEKWHGLKDIELRYRKRYLDLLANTEVKETFILRSRLIQKMRSYLEEQGFLEVETPVLTPVAGGANARPFITRHNALDTEFYLKIAHELYLKRLIVGGFEKIYEIGKIFRNEGISTRHNPEFTMIELYQAYADYRDMMELIEQMVYAMAEEVMGTGSLEYGEIQLELKPPWERISMLDAIRKQTGLDFGVCSGADEAREAAENLGIEIEEDLSWGQVVNTVFEEVVEKKLKQPTIVCDYPLAVSPLAKKKEDDPRLTYRFEVFIGGEEVANAFSELNDPDDQRQRFEKQLQEREAGDEEAHMMDEDFIQSLEYGMPPTGGLGIGIDRLVMILTNSPSIRDVILFPQMKPD